MSELERVVYLIRPEQRAAIKQLAKEQGESSETAAVRAILDQWIALRRERIRNAGDALCDAEARATLALPTS